MSGHSKWSSIKHQKAAADQKRGKVFAKLARIIAVAARDGADPAMNPRLRSALQTAREWNMSKETVLRAIQKGTGQEQGEKFEEMLYEAVGPEGIVLLIAVITDNRNRTSSELKHLLAQYGAKLAQEGAARWLFDLKGIMTINEPLTEELLKAALDAGAQDLRENADGTVTLIVPKEATDAIRKKLEETGRVIGEQALEWIPKNEQKMREDIRQNLERLFAALDEREDVQETYSNLASTSE